MLCPLPEPELPESELPESELFESELFESEPRFELPVRLGLLALFLPLVFLALLDFLVLPVFLVPLLPLAVPRAGELGWSSRWQRVCLPRSVLPGPPPHRASCRGWPGWGWPARRAGRLPALLARDARVRHRRAEHLGRLMPDARWYRGWRMGRGRRRVAVPGD